MVLLRPSTPSAPAAGSAAPTTTPLATSPDADAQRRLTGRQQTKHPIQTGDARSRHLRALTIGWVKGGEAIT